MHFGLTYDLKDDYAEEGFSKEELAEFDSEETIIAIEKELQKQGHTTERIGNISALVSKLAAGKHHKWDMVFNICEGVYGYGREAQVPALLDAYKIPYVFSDALTLAITLHKGLTKRIIRDSGINTSAFVEVNSLDDIKNVNLDFPLFCKPIAEGTSKGVLPISKVNNEKKLKTTLKKLLEKYQNQSILVEEYLPGREFTVGIVGTGNKAKVLGVLEIIVNKDLKLDYTFDVKQTFEDKIKYVKAENDEITKKCAELSLQAWKRINGRDAGRVDIKIDKHGNPAFIEVNPLAGLNPVISDLPLLCYAHGITYSSLIKEIIQSALERRKK